MKRYLLQKSTDEGWWVATDTENGIVCKFKEHQFNETQKFTPLYDEQLGFDPATIARTVNEMGKWLRENHYDLIF